MDTKGQVMADTEMFRQLFDEMDANGCFNNRLPNDGEPYDDEAEYADLVRYEKGIKNPNSLSFWRAVNVGK